MCGIAGGWERAGTTTFKTRLHDSLENLRHRGPDDVGTNAWHFGGDSVVSLGSTRLAVLDLSEAGHMPMVSEDGRFILTYNGEITNYLEIREELVAAGRSFRSRTDTEVLMQAWQHWGVDSLDRFEGMYAFALLDKAEATLTLTRDVFGIKPLYFAFEAGKSLYYGSEVPGLITLRPSRPHLNWQTAMDYLRWGAYDGSSETFVDGIEQVLPAHFVTLDLHAGTVSPQTRYWWPPVNTDHSITIDEATERVRTLFLGSVQRNLRSDVPVGVALSGGIDSSAIACSIRHLDPDYELRSFSFIYPGFEQSEEKWIDLVASAIGSHSHTVAPSSSDLGDDLDDMINAQGEPFRSTSIYAQYRVFRLAREHGVVVTLDGQGADEMFAGYSGYPAHRLHSLIETGHLIEASTFLGEWRKWPGRSAPATLVETAAQFLPRRAAVLLGGARARESPLVDYAKLAERGIRTGFPRVEADTQRGSRLKSHLRDELMVHGLGALLRHGDRNSMRFSVESRVPFLDRALVEYSLSLPEDFLLGRDGTTKKIFRGAMRGIVPDAVLDRRDKVGFATPEKAWLTELTASAASGTSGGEAGIGFLRDGSPERRLLSSAPEEALELGPGAHWRLLNLNRWVQLLNIDGS